MEKFEVNESVIVKHNDGGTSSGKVIREVEADTYLVFYISDGWKTGRFHSSQLTSFGTALFLCLEAYEAHQTELAEATT